ncbi:MAG TPA: hypothetical protein VLC09_09005 [Polyangiaceae bacterium]|nr:hypothetical protein [Polyangiaceae bacterium]
MRTGSTLELDTSLWPIVVSTPHGAISDGDLQRLFDTFDSFWKRGEMFVTVSNMTSSRDVSARQRQMVGEWLKKNKTSIQRYSAGGVLIVDSALLRGALTAIGWVYQAPLDMSYVKDWTEATDTALARLAKVGISEPGLRARMLEFGKQRAANAS